MAEDIFDLIIIGGGPTGMFGGFYAGLRGMRFKILDSLEQLGGQVSAMYPEKDIFDVAGFPRVSGKKLVKDLEEQLLRFKPHLHLGEKVMGLTKRSDGVFELTTDKGYKHHCKAVVLTLGMGSFTPKKHPNAEIIPYEGKGVQYGVLSLEPFKGKRALVVGGGDSALDWALMLEPICSEVTLIHRRDEFRAHEDSVRKLKASEVKVKLWYELRTVKGNGKVEEAVIYENHTNQDESLAVDFVILNFGFQASLGFLKDWGLTLEKNKIPVNQKMETNVPGIYAAGDIVTHPGKLDLIATGFAEGATAVNFAKTYINPNEKAEPGHSSNLKW
jgi:ferredoxin/flavodoxin---NADP+ reductase